jgi:hypothetical protein
MLMVGLVGVMSLLQGCAVVGPQPQAKLPASGHEPSTSPWGTLALPGKRPTVYRHGQQDGRRVILAEANASASMYRQRLVVEPERLGRVRFAWWVPDLIAQADLGDRDSADSPVRVVLAFDGDHGRLSPRTRLQFELAQTLSGELPPYATLMYVWDNRSLPETVLPGGRSDRIRKIVVDSGPGQLRAWRLHERNIARDFERAFGEPPGRLIGVALMTDSDNTAARARGVYGELVLVEPDGATRQLNE